MTKYIALAAITLDGKIAKNSRHFTDWTSKEDKIFFRKELEKGDAIIVGNNTYKTARTYLSKRNCIVFTRKTRTVKKVKNLLYCNPKNLDLKKLIKDLRYKRINILGGAETYSFCLKNGLFDELYLTIEPIVFGQGIGLFSEKHDKKFTLVSTKKLNKQGSILLHYKKK
ncbi:hypothetical protein CL629_03725 [bacterium]|nr:hypothetical protein [bacterium]|tara:strand:+ start:11883 stop:12389 length:507 start_codon:yes stop_codon:yes gene_type:complete